MGIVTEEERVMGRKIPILFAGVDYTDVRDALCRGITDCSDMKCDECLFDAPSLEFKEWFLEKLNKTNNKKVVE